MDLPLEAALAADDDKSGAPFGGLPFGKARLGLPITDLFPHLLSDFSPQLLAPSKAQSKIRLRQGVFLPASKVNKRYSRAYIVTLSRQDLDKKHLMIAGRKIPVRSDQWSALKAGHPVSVPAGDALVRILPPAEPDPPEEKRASAVQHPIVAGAPFSSLRDLSNSQFEALCFVLFLDRNDPNFSWVDELTARDRAILAVKCKLNHRFSAFNKRVSTHKPEPPRYEIGFISEYEQAWDLAGYSRGGLISSITLAPEEELTIEIFTWDRSKLENESTETTETERSVESSSLARVSSQLNNDLTETTDKNTNIGLGAPLPIGPINVDASLKGSVSDNITQSIKSTVDTLNEASVRASERFKSTNQVKVVQTRETGSETRVTRRIRNPNRGRTLTMHCFEVMEHYNITTKLLRANKFVLLVEVPQPKDFSIHFVLAHEEKLQRALLGPNFLPGFVAAKKLLAQRFFDHRSQIKAEIEAAQAKARGDSAPPADPPIVSIAKDMRKRLNRMVHLNLIDEVATLANAYLPGNSISHKDRAEAEDALGVFNFWLKFKTVTPGVDSRAQDYLESTSGDISPEKAYEALNSLITGIDDGWLTTIKMIAASVVAAQLGFTLLVPFPWLSPVLFEFALLENDLGLSALIDRAKQAVRAYEVTLQQPPAPTDPNNDKGQKMMPPPQLFTLQELSLADAEFKKLVWHLEANRVYYMNSILAQQDANVRYETLKALGVQNFVENRLLGFLGSRAVFPLRIENLEDEARTYLQDKLTDKLSKLLKDVEPMVTEDLSLPTSGMHMEPALGQCEALEPYLHDRRDIDLKVRRAAAARAHAEAQQQAQEVHRLEERLAQTPPLLDSPFSTVLPATPTVTDDSDGTTTPP